ncbi:DUF262 domain-containing protein [Massilia sp. B-10]|nr:DUF262 domain-containing protein [Massilia sp. B-10]
MNQIIDNVKPESRSIKVLTDGLATSTIVIDDSFQRKFVWSLKDQVSLIETILMGFPIPEIYLWQNDTDAESGDTIFSVVDGQQRIRSILNFIDNKFVLDKRSLDHKKAAYAGKKFDELDPELKKIIWKYPFSVRFISDEITHEEIVKIFLRLNRTNITLNPQELRNAEFNGDFIKLAAELADLPFWTSHAIFNDSDIRRMTDIQFISTLLIFLRKGIEEETTQGAINKIYDQYNNNYPEAKSDESAFKKVLAVLSIFSNENPHVIMAYKSKTHLYTLFLLGYYLSDQPKAFLLVTAKKLEEWYRHYTNVTSFHGKAKQALLTEYRTLTVEGVQKKPIVTVVLNY